MPTCRVLRGTSVGKRHGVPQACATARPALGGRTAVHGPTRSWLRMNDSPRLAWVSPQGLATWDDKARHQVPRHRDLLGTSPAASVSRDWPVQRRSAPDVHAPGTAQIAKAGGAATVRAGWRRPCGRSRTRQIAPPAAGSQPGAPRNVGAPKDCCRSMASLPSWQYTRPPDAPATLMK